MSVGALSARQSRQESGHDQAAGRIVALQRQLRRSSGSEALPTPSLLQSCEMWSGSGYTRRLFEYQTGQEPSRHAFLLMPEGSGPFPVAIDFRSHATSLRASSGVCDSDQALGTLGPSLAQSGICVFVPEACATTEAYGPKPTRARRARDVVLPAPRINPGGLELESASRIPSATAVRAAIQDVKFALQVFRDASLDTRSVGTFGHAMGANLCLITAALFEQIAYLAVSGAQVLGPLGRQPSRAKLTRRTRYQLAPEIPLTGVLECLTPKRVLLVDSDDGTALERIYQEAASCFSRNGHLQHLMQLHVAPGRGLVRLSQDVILGWMQAEAQRATAPSPVHSGVNVTRRRRAAPLIPPP